ncbi:MAG: polysaccharide deacetylase family protein, partial [Lentisphaeraceae bacterium]|nr:polysaccharide deacetylase family protein [Lentisphaeraceae bacterium]
MIYLTGDLHDMSLKSGNQKHCIEQYGLTELEVAQKYTALLSEAKVKATFFITGRSFKDEWPALKPICDSPLIETAGHTYNCYLSPWCEWTGIRLLPDFWARFWNKFSGSYNGPKWYHLNDTLKTKRIIKQKTGKEITLWRHHMYMHGKYTDTVMHESGIKLISDGVQKDSTGPVKVTEELFSFQINIIPDHEHLIHAERTPEWIEWWQKRYNWSDDYGSESYYIEEWTDMVLAGLKEREEKGVPSLLIIHPIT